MLLTLRLMRVSRVIRLFKEGPVKDINRIITAVSSAVKPIWHKLTLNRIT